MAAGSPVTPAFGATLQDPTTSTTIVSSVAYGNAMEVAGLSIVNLQVAGNTTGAIVTPQVTVDGVNWVGIQVTNPISGSTFSYCTQDGIYRANVVGCDQIRAPISGAGHAMTITALGIPHA